MDLRVSGKDLIKNHLTMSLYNHAEIWADDASKWPRSFFTNGHILVDAQKMSKSEGNFLMLQGSVTGTGPKGDGNMTWSADSVRFTLCDGGDGLDDANFDSKVANQAVLRLTTEAEWIKEMVAAADGGAQVAPRVADVRAEAEVSGPHWHAERRRYSPAASSSSSGSSSSGACEICTATSPSVSSTGGSGFARRTVTAVPPKSSRIRSATTWPSRSNVL